MANPPLDLSVLLEYTAAKLVDENPENSDRAEVLAMNILDRLLRDAEGDASLVFSVVKRLGAHVIAASSSGVSGLRSRAEELRRGAYVRALTIIVASAFEEQEELE